MKEHAVESFTRGWFSYLGYDNRRRDTLSPHAEPSERGSYEDVTLEPRLRAALRRVNEHLPEDAIDQALRVATRPPEPTLPQNNRWFHRLLKDGIDVEYRTEEGETRGDKAWLVDFEHPERNEFVTGHEFIVKNGNNTRRPDFVVFLNGLPIAVLELKNPTDESADLWQAYRQLQDYKRRVPQLFTYNELLCASDSDSSRVGSLTAGPDRFSPWRSFEDYRRPGPPSLEMLITELFEPHHLLEYLRYCVTFEEDGKSGEIVKKIAAYHQFRAVRNALASVKAALKPPTGPGDGRGGVVWHTQGSGKSLTMLMLSGALIADEQLENPTIVVVTDRNDLDGQLYDTFAAGWELLRQHPEQAESRNDLTAKLDRASGGVIFTTIQKFKERGDPVSERSNIVVLADEAHRSQYGFLKGGARWMRQALPNATFVGFTGTPLESDDRDTRAVFGDYADIYDIRQAIDDQATVPIFYEMQHVSLQPDEQGVREAEASLEKVLEANRQGQESYFEIRLEALAGAERRLKLVAEKIVEHFEARRQAIEGKAMAVCMSRDICMNLYDHLVALKPEWHAEEDDAGFVKVVIDPNPRPERFDDDPKDYQRHLDQIARHGRTKAQRKVIERRFKDPDDDLRVVIVCDMWLTGFDCPPLHTMYLDKPLAGHNLMQAIARVNRVFGDKPGGVVVDFIGIAEQLRDAVQTYTQAGGEGSPVEAIQDQAVPLMLRHFEALCDFWNGFDYSAFAGGREEEQLPLITAGANHVFEQQDGKRRFLKMTTALSKAFALAVPRPETEPVRDPLTFFQAVRAAIRKRLADDGPPPPPDTRAAVRQVISGAIASQGVIDLFEAAGLPKADVGILSDEFLERLAALPHKNLALETLRKLLHDQIKSRERVNIVQSRSFRESLEAVLTRYANRAITTAQVIEELIGLAREIRAAQKRGEEMGLSEEEKAFYDALADNASAREVMQENDLKTIARQLAERIKAKASLDWTQRESVRADMRRTVRRLLAKHGYPPDAQESATQLVISQAERIAENEVVSSTLH